MVHKWTNHFHQIYQKNSVKNANQQLVFKKTCIHKFYKHLYIPSTGFLQFPRSRQDSRLDTLPWKSCGKICFSQVLTVMDHVIT